MFVTQGSDKLHLYDAWLNGVFCVATVAVLAGGYFAAIRPLDVLIHNVRSEATGLQELIQQASEITRKHQTLSVTLAQSRQSADELAQRIPAAPRESDFLSQISQLAGQTGLEVADYHPGLIEMRENHHEMEVKVSTHGRYESLCKFLKQIDGLPRLCRLAQLDIETQAKEDQLRVEMLFRIYFAPPATATAKKG